jgi:hypothetical protein
MRSIGLTVITLASLLVASSRAEADDVIAITTAGKGDLTMCPYMGYMGCNLYHHVRLPPKIAVGDSVRVHFGSNPKHYSFPVARIVSDDGACTVYSQTSKTEGVEKIVIASCAPVPAE